MALKEYTVTADAVTVTTGYKDGKPVVARLNRLATIKAEPTDERIETLLSLKAIAPSEKVKGKNARTTALIASRAQGAPDDPVATPVQDVLPLPATVNPSAASQAPRVDDGNIGLADVAGE